MERSLDPKTGQSRKIKPIKWSRYLIISIFNFLLFCILVNHNWKATSVILMTYIARVITTLFTTTVEFLLPFFFFTLIYFLFIYFFAGVYGFLFKLYNIVLILSNNYVYYTYHCITDNSKLGKHRKHINTYEIHIRIGQTHSRWKHKLAIRS